MASHHSKFTAALNYQMPEVQPTIQVRSANMLIQAKKPAISAYFDIQSYGQEIMCGIAAHDRKSVNGKYADHGLRKKARANLRDRQLHNRMIMQPK